MKISTRVIPWALGLAGLLALVAVPGFAADEAALSPELTEATVATTEATPAVDPTEPALESALETSWPFPQDGDCILWCGSGQYRYYNVTRDECCGGTLTCPDGSYPGGYAFYPYQGFAEFCSY